MDYGWGTGAGRVMPPSGKGRFSIPTLACTHSRCFAWGLYVFFTVGKQDGVGAQAVSCVGLGTYATGVHRGVDGSPCTWPPSGLLLPTDILSTLSVVTGS